MLFVALQKKKLEFIAMPNFNCLDINQDLSINKLYVAGELKPTL